ncbi:MAG: phosphate ABC transporter permease PstA [Nitrospirae bacterium]|nr:MAG: phosphate ABC transporter permease PstA [Nitrospirota bacterium]
MQDIHGKSRARLEETLAALGAWIAAILVLGVFGWILGDLLWHGWPSLSWEFVFDAPRDAGRAGGIGPILVSTALLLGICLAVALPIGFGAALCLAELAARAAWPTRLIRRSLDILAGMPSILFGLFGNAVFCVILGFGFSLLSGGLTLACMVLPLVIRSADEALRSVPAQYRLSAAALGLSRGATLWHLIVPAALPGVLVGFTLAVGRALAETAALIFTSGYVDRLPHSLLDSGRALSVHIFDLAMNVPGGDAHAYASALVLVTMLLAINLVASRLGSRWSLCRMSSI